MHEGAVSAELGFAGYPSVAESLMVERDLSLAAYEDAAAPPAASLRTRVGRRARGRAQAKGVAATGRGHAAPPLPDRRGGALARLEPEDEPAAALGRRPRRADRRRCATARSSAIATDHAPHARHEKEVPFEAAPFGVTGLETAFARALHAPRRAGPAAARDAARADVGRAGARVRARAAADRGRRAGESRPARHRVAPGGWSEGGFRSRSANSWLLGQTLRGRVRLTVAAGRIAFAHDRGRRTSTRSRHTWREVVGAIDALVPVAGAYVLGSALLGGFDPATERPRPRGGRGASRSSRVRQEAVIGALRRAARARSRSSSSSSTRSARSPPPTS